MNLKLAALALLISAIPAVAQTTVERGYRFERTAPFRIYSLAGSVRVTGWDRDSLHIRATVAKGDAFRGGASPSGGKMFIENQDERNPRPSIVEVFVPARAKIWIKTATGSVTATGVSGAVDIYTISGPITVVGNPSELNAEAIDGNISVKGTPRWLRAKSASGSVGFSGSCEDGTLSTVSGAVTVDGGIFDRGKLESVTGAIRFRGSVARGGSVAFDTHSGLVDLRLWKPTGTDIQLVTMSGKISNALTSTRPAAGRYGRGGELTTSQGEGGAQLTVKSFKGDITLRGAKYLPTRRGLAAS